MVKKSWYSMAGKITDHGVVTLCVIAVFICIIINELIAAILWVGIALIAYLFFFGGSYTYPYFEKLFNWIKRGKDKKRVRRQK